MVYAQRTVIPIDAMKYRLVRPTTALAPIPLSVQHGVKFSLGLLLLVVLVLLLLVLLRVRERISGFGSAFLAQAVPSRRPLGLGLAGGRPVLVSDPVPS